jgi:hypothetical protein
MTNAAKNAAPWEQRLKELLPLYGHRNWVVVADSAYPVQSKPGIETIVSGIGQIEAVEKTLKAIAAVQHVRANVYTDRELGFVAEKDAPGITEFRQQLTSLLDGAEPQQLPHDEIIAKLDKSAEVFRILIIKTELTIPYTSVFFELDCGYWNAAAEKRLRKAIKND